MRLRRLCILASLLGVLLASGCHHHRRHCWLRRRCYTPCCEPACCTSCGHSSGYELAPPVATVAPPLAPIAPVAPPLAPHFPGKPY